MGVGYFKKIVLRSGFELWFSSCKYHEKTKFVSCESSLGLHFNFVLSGECRCISEEQSSKFKSTEGHQHIVYFPYDSVHEIYPYQIFSDVCIVVKPELFYSLFDRTDDFLDCDLNKVTSREHYRQCSVITTEMREILQRIIYCNVSRSLRKLFLESQALYLLYCQLAQWHPEKVINERPVYHPRDLEAIQQVKRFLEKNLNSKHNLSTLANLAGMSHTKLNRCFKEIYGLTVFKFLREKRLVKAHELLGMGYTVTEIAYQLGYSSLSHFSQTFYRYYGIYPNQIRRQ